MTPGAPYRWTDEAAMRGFVRDIGFGLLCAAGPDRLHAVHLPLVWLDERRIGLHLHRANPIGPHLDGGEAMIVVTGPDAYVSPDWYGDPDRVPTWSYVAVELRGAMARLDRDATIAQVDALSAEQERRLSPKPAWTRDKMHDGLFDRLLSGLVGFAMDVTAMHGTAKLAQDKPEAARHNVSDALDAIGKPAMAALIRNNAP